MDEEIQIIKKKHHKETDKNIILNELKIAQFKIARFCNHVKAVKNDKKDSKQQSKKQQYQDKLK